MTLLRTYDGYRVFSVIVFLALWHLLSISADPNFLPGPADVIKDFLSVLGTQKFYAHVMWTVLKVFVAVTITGIASFAVFLFAQKSVFIRAFYDSVLYPVAVAVPAVSWALIAVVWFGFSAISPIFIVSMSILPVFLINLGEGFRQLDKDLVEAARSFTHNETKILTKVTVPLLYPFIFSSFRIAMSAAWKIVILAEVFASLNGVGFLMGISMETANITRIFSLTLLIVLILAFTEIVLDRADKVVFRGWRHGLPHKDG